MLTTAAHALIGASLRPARLRRSCVRNSVRATVRDASQAIYGDVDLAAETFDTMFKVRFACVRMRTC